MALKAGDSKQKKAAREAKAYRKLVQVAFDKARERLYEANTTKQGIPEAIAEYMRCHPRLQGPK